MESPKRCTSPQRALFKETVTAGVNPKPSAVSKRTLANETNHNTVGDKTLKHVKKPAINMECPKVLFYGGVTPGVNPKLLEISETNPSKASPNGFSNRGNKFAAQNTMSPPRSGAISQNVMGCGGCIAYNAKSQGSQSSRPGALPRTPAPVQAILNQEAQWDFDVIALEKITNRRPLVHLGMKVFSRFGACEYLNIEESTLVNWFNVIEENYRVKNPYHNSTHAADVMQAVAYFLNKPRNKEIFDQQDQVGALIAAAVHDVDHPARTNAFLINERHELAILYNDQAVLENHHASLCFQITHKDKNCDIFKNLSPEDYKTVRQSIIDQVLATDMKQHFEHLSKFTTSITKHLVAKLGTDSTDVPLPSVLSQLINPRRISKSGIGTQQMKENETPAERHEPDLATLMEELKSHEDRTLIKRMMIKCADVSNPLRPIQVCKQWAERIAAEYCDQTDDEKKRGLPVVMAQFDRKTLNIPKCQLAFINLFIIGMFDAWDTYCDIPELMKHLQANFDYWKEQEAMIAAKKHKSSPTKDTS